ncbi:MAG: hypothetical protein RPV21_06435 [Candidatus Sedimenticola sp. (ex Thyasira tokunagai)]
MHPITVLILITSVLITIYMHMRRASFSHVENRSNTRPTKRVTFSGEKREIARFHGFSITTDSDCCQAASVLKDVTFASKDIVNLPLKSCTKGLCSCKKVLILDRRHYTRRIEFDRRIDLRLETDKVIRRKGKGRRRSDKVWSSGYLYS